MCRMPAGPITKHCAPIWAGKRVGLLGGSFNPAHAGHVHISRTALKRLKLDAVWWLVSPQNPLKSATDMAPQAMRLEMARTVERHPRIIATDIETQLGTRYTIDTLMALTGLFAQTRFVWLMGADSLAGFHRWKDWADIARLLPIAVLLRPGYTDARWSAPSMARLSRYRHQDRAAPGWTKWRTPALVILSLPMDSTSATALRRANPDWAKRAANRRPELNRTRHNRTKG
jgi:nicotinate-nucleotide adenylyltransferase